MSRKTCICTRPSVVAVAAVALFAAGACSTIHVDVTPPQAGVLTDPGQKLATAQAYAWAGAPVVSEEASDLDADLGALVEAAIDERLHELGWRRIDGKRPDVIVSARVDVATRRDVNDPFYSHHDLRRYEEGAVTLTVRDRVTHDLLWSGTGRRNIRYTADEIGLFSSTFVETGEPRDWRIDGLVEAVVSRLADAPGLR